MNTSLGQVFLELTRGKLRPGGGMHPVETPRNAIFLTQDLQEII
jgi:hypothetical protein